MRRSYRRATAVMLALAFFGFSAETLIADVHDGDAPASEVAKFGAEHAHGGPDHAPSLAPIDADADHGAPTPPATPDAPERDGHTYHSCHCAHAHGGAPPTHAPVAADLYEPSALIAESDRAPASAALEPGLRPPIA